VTSKSSPAEPRRPLRVGIAPPLGAAVRLLRDGRAGRVVAHAQGGLLCRVRLDGRAGPGETVECSGSELVPVADGSEVKERSPAATAGEVRRDARGLRPASGEVRVVLAPTSAEAGVSPPPAGRRDPAGPAGGQTATVTRPRVLAWLAHGAASSRAPHRLRAS